LINEEDIKYIKDTFSAVQCLKELPLNSDPVIKESNKGRKEPQGGIDKNSGLVFPPN